MSTIEYDNFTNALKRLKERYADYIAKKQETHDHVIIESLTESCIQRFEVCYDVIRKYLKKYLRQLNGAVATDDINNLDAKSVFAIAFKAGIITDADRWDTFNACRNYTSHEYNEDKATQTFAIIPDFIEEAQDLYQKMTTAP